MKELIDEMSYDLAECHVDYLDDAKLYTDYDTMAQKMVSRGYRKQSEWISVTDRLPTECENVLCFEKGKVYVAFLENAEYSAVWWDWVDYDRDDTWTERTPTHWMPLPEPPKGE